MTNVLPFQSPDESSSQACEWLARIERDLTPSEEANLRQWLTVSPANAKSLLEAAAAWDRMNSLSRLADLFPKPAPKNAGTALRQFALASAVLIGLCAGLYVALQPETMDHRTRAARHVDAILSERYETAVGESSTIVLSDGSELTLNTNSSVKIEFSEAHRVLRLDRGEIFVKVAHDEVRPLAVWVGDRIVQAVGTAFNVHITSDQRVEVIVTDGSVVIGLMDPGASTSEPAWIETYGMPVAAGQRVLLGDEKPAVKDIDAAEIDVRLSWRDGNLVFQGEPLAEALGQIERYTRVTFVIQDEQLKTIRVAGLFKAGDVDGLLANLRDNFNISYERIGQEKIVLKSE